LEARDGEGVSDPKAFDAKIRKAVAGAVRSQVDAGVDVINDGEQGRYSYSTYVKDRLSGFGGETHPVVRTDWEDFPEALARIGLPTLRLQPACNGPVVRTNAAEIQKDLANLREAVSGVNVDEVFMTAASPGVISLFLQNEYYPSREGYLAALADAMHDEYLAIHQAGFLLQLDCPDLAMGRHMQFPDLSNEEFLKLAEENVEVLNHAVRDIPSDRMRLHLCWGNYEGPHHRDISLKEVFGVALMARPDGISFEGSNPRHEHEWTLFKDLKLPDGKVIIPGVVDSTNNYIEHPELVAQRIVRYAGLVGRENVIAGSDCGFGTFARAAPRVEPEIAWLKLGAMAEGSRLASRELW
jgi:5-methyltetrahydropteroyltriglutamate--homocysteine methyltransferase